jgi:hypothetical protein
MTYDETLVIMSILKANFPAHAGKLDKAGAVSLAKLWEYQFKDYDAKIVTAAVMAVISSKSGDWFPQVADVMDKVHLLTTPQSMTAQEAWGIVAKAIQNSTYGSRDEFEKLPPTIKRTVYAPEQLKEWAAMKPEIVQSVIASNFMSSYRAKAKHESEIQALPSDVRLMLDKSIGGLMLDKPSET